MEDMLEKLIDKFSESIKSYNKDDQKKILDAAHFAASHHGSQLRKSGEPYFIHPISVAKILIQLNGDCDTVCAGLLHDTIEDTDTTYEDVAEKFGKQVADIVEGETKIASIKAKNKTIQESETIRKMLFAMSQDIRVLIVKLADKLHNMRTLEFLAPKRQKEIANETLDIYAPLADRLGISWLKAELEDLSLKTLKPDTYAYILDYLNANKSERKAYLTRIEKTILKACANANIKDVKVTTREKHIYSIYMKMKKRQKDLEEIYDILGVRIICSSINECYTLLGIIHRLWPPIEGRFKDYIAMPKANNYQSLHTTVLSLDAKMLELQIRTLDMHQTAEYGVAAHWAYKAESGSYNVPSKTFNNNVIEKLKAWSSEIEQSDSLLDDIKDELLKDTIFVFTPKGHTVELPSGASALDFAYHIHTGVGNTCVGAKADGSIIPLNKPLKNTQVIEIITQANAKPNINWLRMAHTATARKKIRNWLNHNDPTLTIDKNIIAKEKIVIEEKKDTNTENKQEVDNKDIVRHVTSQTTATLKVGEEKNLMISIAQCCNPTRGDDIVGYVSRGRGIIVHKSDCHNLKNMPEIDKRAISVEWESTNSSYTAKFKVLSKRTPDLFSEIEGAVRKFKGHLIEGRLDDDDLGRLIGSFTIEVLTKEDSKKIIKNLKTIPNVIAITPLL